MSNFNTTLVVVPAHNEALLVGDTVCNIIKATNLPVLVVNDASTDETGLKAKQSGAQVMTLAAQLGAWGATQTGLRYALRHHYSTVITIDADGQHDVQGIKALLHCLERQRADIVIGTCTQRGSVARKTAWVLFRILSGLTISDLTSGFRAYSKESLQILSKYDASGLDYQDIGVLCLLRQAGLTFSEVNVRMYPRRNGKSRIFNSWLSVFKYMLYSTILSICHFKFTSKK